MIFRRTKDKMCFNSRLGGSHCGGCSYTPPVKCSCGSWDSCGGSSCGGCSSWGGSCGGSSCGGSSSWGSSCGNWGGCSNYDSSCGGCSSGCSCHKRPCFCRPHCGCMKKSFCGPILWIGLGMCINQCCKKKC